MNDALVHDKAPALNVYLSYKISDVGEIFAHFLAASISSQREIHAKHCHQAMVHSICS